MYKKTLIALAVSAAILGALFYRVNFGLLLDNFRNIPPKFILLYLASFAAFYTLEVWRWKLIANSHYRISSGESFRQIAATGSINILVPSKIGTLGKAYFLMKEGEQGRALPVSMVLYEKFSELFGMSFFIVLFYALNPFDNVLVQVVLALAVIFIISYFMMHRFAIMPRLLRPFSPKSRLGQKLVNLLSVLDLYCRKEGISPARKLKINLLSVVLWAIHCYQFILFFQMLGLKVPMAMAVLGVISALVVGLLPVALAGDRHQGPCHRISFSRHDRL